MRCNKKEHFDIADSKVSIGNSITSLKRINRINFLEIFETINGVEEILKKDPANVYEKWIIKLKEIIENKIKEIFQNQQRYRKYLYSKKNV